MLVSKIKPCMSQYEPMNGEIAYGSLKRLFSMQEGNLYMDTSGNSGDNTCAQAQRSRRAVDVSVEIISV